MSLRESLSWRLLWFLCYPFSFLYSWMIQLINGKPQCNHFLFREHKKTEQPWNLLYNVTADSYFLATKERHVLILNEQQKRKVERELKFVTFQSTLAFWAAAEKLLSEMFFLEHFLLGCSHRRMWERNSPHLQRFLEFSYSLCKKSWSGEAIVRAYYCST